MNILIFGSTGFIGSQVKQRLVTQGYKVITPTSRDIDFTNSNTLDLAKIKRLIQNVDVVINMVGVMSHDKALMENVHHHTPLKIASLFKKNAKTQGVKTWINLSALGANPTHEVAFVSSKGRGDAAILSLNDESLRVKIARPSLVFGRGNFGKGGASFEMFVKLAKLPILILPNGGKFTIQPVNVADVTQGLVNLALHKNNDLPPIINFTGENVITLKDYLSKLRFNFYQKNLPIILNLPMPLAKFFAQILQYFSDIVSVDSLILLENGNVADNTDFIKLLGHTPTLKI